jgi:nucleoside-diphosphate-sugar epimerase
MRSDKIAIRERQGGFAFRSRQAGIRFMVPLAGANALAGICLVTGATGLLGSHVAEQLVRRGERVRALARPNSDRTFLQSLGVEIVTGDLETNQGVEAACQGVDRVFHCAARVGEWGDPRQIRSQIVNLAQNLKSACIRAAKPRVVHVSSVTVYGKPSTPGPWLESEPLGQNVYRSNHYCHAKIEAEGLWSDYPGQVVVVRPSWIFGPRDRVTLPRVVKAFLSGRLAFIGDGSNPLNIVFAPDVADGCIRAMDLAPDRHIYNLSSSGQVSVKEFMDTVADELGLPRVKRHYPLAFAKGLALFSEFVGKLIRLKRPPHLTRYNLGLLTRPCLYSTESARREIGWEERTPIREALRQTLDWHWRDLPPSAPIRQRREAEQAPSAPTK